MLAGEAPRADCIGHHGRSESRHAPGALPGPRTIAHVDLDAFFASVEQLLDPDLVGKPVIVGGNPRGRGVVSSASYEARAFGVRSAMPCRHAHRLCPQARFVRGHFDRYEEFSERVFEICREFTPILQPASIDEGYLDLTGTHWAHFPSSLAGAPAAIPDDWPVIVAERLRRRVRSRAGLTVSVGLAANKLMAKIATNHAKPDGVCFVRPGTERAYLAPMPLRVIPGLGRQTEESLSAEGLTRVGDLLEVSREQLIKWVGPAAAESLRQKANGRCEARVQTDDDRDSISHETTFEVDTSDRNFLRATLDHLTRRACWKLRAEGRAARTVTVKLRYRDFKTVTHARRLEDPTDHDAEVSATAGALLDRVYARPLPVRLVGVRLSGLTEAGPRQLRLWTERRRAKHSRIYAVSDEIRRRFGFNALASGRSLELISRRKASR
ncbi:MAG: DNA polymerase IV [Phycisphaerae bacterium]|nr:DNA polymerase IV [Phycisphaerae bacterium]